MNLTAEYMVRTPIMCLLVIIASALMLTACQQEQMDDSASTQEAAVADTLAALEDFERTKVEGFVPYYKDKNAGALAIDAATYPGQFAAAETQWDGPSGTYDPTIVTVPEEDGESTYRMFVNGTPVGEFTNPETDEAFAQATHTWSDIELSTGDTIRITSNPHSNGKIPEGDGYAYSRGRWKHLVITSNR